MEMMAGSAQSAVDSLLGRISSTLLDEARRLGRVHDDVKFIRDEMESMNGFLLDVAAAGRPDNQVRAWMLQVRKVANDSQDCMDRYIHTFGAAGRPSAGLLATVGRAAHKVRTLPERRLIARQIEELKARAQEVAERRHRYGITVPAEPPAPVAATGTAEPGARDAADERDARRRDALAGADRLLDIDVSVAEVVAWLRCEDSALHRGHHELQLSALRDAWNNIRQSPSNSMYSAMTIEAIKLARWAIYGDKNAENISEGFSVVEQISTSDKLGTEIEVIVSGIKEKIKMIKTAKDDWNWKKVGEAVRFHLPRGTGTSKKKPEDHHGTSKKKPEDHHGTSKKKPADHHDDEAAGDHEEIEDHHHKQLQHAEELVKWILGMCHANYPRLLAMVTPPVDVHNPEFDQPPTHGAATELARRVSDHPRTRSYFDRIVWVDARLHSQRRQRLACMLQQLNPGFAEPAAAGEGEDDKLLEQLILQRLMALKRKRFLVVLADHEDFSPWEDILGALPLPCDRHHHSAIIVTPLMHRTKEFYRWCMVNRAFLKRDDRYKVYFYPYIDGVRKKATDLLIGSNRLRDSRGTVDNILKKCRWDSLSWRMFVHALYDNPHRSKDDLERLLMSLADFSTVSNTSNILRFYYDGLPGHRRSCLLYLSIFTQGCVIRRTSLLRRWAAEMVKEGDGLGAVDKAESCFDALLASGVLVPHGAPGPTGKVRSCTVHHNLVSYIARMAGDENVGNTGVPRVLSHRMSSRLGIQLQEDEVAKKLQNQKRPGSGCWATTSCFGGHRLDHADSLQEQAPELYHLKVLLASFKMGSVRVLDLERCSGLTKRSLAIICDKLRLLVYLNLRNTDATELPKEMEKLQQLETLDIRQTKVQSLPAKSTELLKLVHLLAGGRVGEEEAQADDGGSVAALHMPRGIDKMTGMQTISHVEVSSRRADEDVAALADIGRLQQLRKLGVVIHGDEARFLETLVVVVGKVHASLCSLSICIEPPPPLKEDGNGGVSSSKKQPGNGQLLQPANMNTRDQDFQPPESLESLSISGRITGLPDWVKQLHQLTKITLRGTLLKEGDLWILGKLVSLRCIRLRRSSYDHRELTLKAREFRKLELLVAEGLDITSIRFEQDAAAKLKKIVWSISAAAASGMEVPPQLSGVEQLPCLREVQINGSCDISGIKKAMKANPNHPILLAGDAILEDDASGSGLGSSSAPA